MPLIRDGAIVEDRYRRIEDDGPILEDGAILVPAARFLADAAEFPRRTAPIGVLWPNDRRVAELAPHLDCIALVALQFPKFRDGRAYTQARQLRERYGFCGELRATGDVLRDQFLFMLRAGFDSLEVAKAKDAHAFAEAARRYSVFYQPPPSRLSPSLRPWAEAAMLRMRRMQGTIPAATIANDGAAAQERHSSEA
jgi:uncharacterized protein (DUF934 family)